MIPASGRSDYISALDEADRSNLKAFCDYLGDMSVPSLRSAVQSAKNILSGQNVMLHGNGGVTRDGIYYAPDHDESKQRIPGE